MDVIDIHISQGHVVSNGAYVYCWFHPKEEKIIYIGATWMHPAARAELHLHGKDDKARIVGEQLKVLDLDFTQPMQLFAFSVPSDIDRKKAKNSLVVQCRDAQLLSSAYFGPEPTPVDSRLDDLYTEWVQEAMAHINAHKT